MIYVMSGGGNGKSEIIVTSETGSTVTATMGSKTKTATEKNGTWTFKGCDIGTWNITATKNGQTATGTVVINEADQRFKYYITLTYFPSAYQRVEYLQSNGEQYINTGYALQNAGRVKLTGFEIDAAFINATSQASTLQIMGTPNYFLGWSDNNKLIFSVGINTGNYSSEFSRTRDNNRHKWISDPINQKISFDGEILYSGSFEPGELNSFSDITLFRASNSIKTSSRLYGAKIKYNGVLVNDFYPCYRKSDNVAGLLCRVTNTFFANAGSGTFTLGGNV